MPSVAEKTLGDLIGRLESRGWAQVDFGEPAFVLREVDDIVYQLRLNERLRGSGIVFFPALGVRHVETSRLVTQFKTGLAQAGAGVASVGCGLSDLLHQAGYGTAPFSRWSVRDPDDSDAVVRRLDDDIDAYALPFFRSLTTLDRVIARLEQQNRHQAADGHLAVARALSGRVADAVDVLVEYARVAQGQTGLMADQSWRFVRSFVEYFPVDDFPVEIPE